MKILNQKYFLSTAISFSLSLAGIVTYEFLYQEKIVLFFSVLFTILSFLFASQLSKEVLEKFRKTLKIILFLMTILVLTHFVVNSFDFYGEFSPPELFYTLKFHRLITLSGALLVHITTLIVGLWFIASKYTNKIRLSFSISLIMLLFLSSLVVYHTEQILATDYKTTAQVFLNMNTNFEDRITYRFGGASYFGWIWPYTQFIKRRTSENSSIIIPPQSPTWKMEGNVGFLRWFLYPRKLINISLDSAVTDQADYALIALGECDEGDCGWPKINIPAEKIEYIVLIDRETQEETIITDRAYTLNKDEFKWGIIKLR